LSPRPGPLSIRLSPVDRAELEQAADAAGVELTAYVRRAALDAAKGNSIVIAGPVATWLREQAALRGMAVEDLAGLVMARTLAERAA
jgi:uncharacterized protein (DUF1778 family)